MCRTHDSGLLRVSLTDGLGLERECRVLASFRIPAPPTPMNNLNSDAAPAQSAGPPSKRADANDLDKPASPQLMEHSSMRIDHMQSKERNSSK